MEKFTQYENSYVYLFEILMLFFTTSMFNQEIKKQ